MLNHCCVVYRCNKQLLYQRPSCDARPANARAATLGIPSLHGSQLHQTTVRPKL
ncbi:unnamed protein product, partial [Musa textilis]